MNPPRPAIRNSGTVFPKVRHKYCLKARPAGMGGIEKSANLPIQSVSGPNEPKPDKPEPRATGLTERFYCCIHIDSLGPKP
jgi:hypothetical protein